MSKKIEGTGTTQDSPLLEDVKLSDPTQPRETEGTESFSVGGFLGKGWKTTFLKNWTVAKQFSFYMLIINY